nr:hypothetical protein [uncultured Ruminococcus sp.]
MTNTKFRKRALLSSVAMLLVALVALGSATFAWFVTKPEANTVGMAAKTSTTSSLLIDSQTDIDLGTQAKGFAHETRLNSTSQSASATATLQPASMDADGALHSVAAELPSNYAPKASGETISSGSAYQEKVYFKLDQGATEAKDVYLKSVNWTANANADMAPAITVAILKKDGTLLGTFNKASRSQKFIPANMTTYAAANLGTRTTTTAGNLTSNIVCGSAALNNTATSELDYVTVVVYLDGEYDKVYSQNTTGNNLNDLLSDLQVNFTLDAPVASP